MPNLLLIVDILYYKKKMKEIKEIIFSERTEFKFKIKFKIKIPKMSLSANNIPWKFLIFKGPLESYGKINLKIPGFLVFPNSKHPVEISTLQNPQCRSNWVLQFRPRVQVYRVAI